jgi:hypothetical protein
MLPDLLQKKIYFMINVIFLLIIRNSNSNHCENGFINEIT